MPTIPVSMKKRLLDALGSNTSGKEKQLDSRLMRILGGTSDEELAGVLGPDSALSRLASKFKREYMGEEAMTSKPMMPGVGTGALSTKTMGLAPKPGLAVDRTLPSGKKLLMDVPEAETLGKLAGIEGGGWMGKIGQLMKGPLGVALVALGLPTILRDWGELLGLRDSATDKQAKLLKQERAGQLAGNAMILSDDADRRREDRSANMTSQVLGAMENSSNRNMIQQAVSAEQAMTPRGRAAQQAIGNEMALMGNNAAGLQISAETPYSDVGIL